MHLLHPGPPFDGSLGYPGEGPPASIWDDIDEAIAQEAEAWEVVDADILGLQAAGEDHVDDDGMLLEAEVTAEQLPVFFFKYFFISNSNALRVGNYRDVAPCGYQRARMNSRNQRA